MGKTPDIDTSAQEQPTVVVPGEVSGFFVAEDNARGVTDQSAIAVTISAYAITLIAGLQAGWFGPLLPSIAQAQDISLEKTGILVSAVCAGGLAALAVSKPVIARLADIKTTLLAAALLALGFFGLGSTHGLIALTGSAFCYGLGAGLNSIASHILFPRYYPTRVASALSKLNVFFGVGALIGPMIVLAFFGLKANYNLIFIGAGIYSAAICVYLLRTISLTKTRSAGQSNNTAQNRQSSAEALKTIITHPILIALALINFFYVGIETSLGAWIYTFLQRAESIDGTVASAGVSLLWLGLTLGRMVSTRACLKVNPKYVTMAAMILLVATIFVAATVHMGPLLALPVVLVIGVGLGPIFPTIVAQSATRFPTCSPTTTTIVIGCGSFGGMLLPWLAGCALVAYGSTNFMLLTGFTASILPILLGLALFPIWRQRQHPES